MPVANIQFYTSEGRWFKIPYKDVECCVTIKDSIEWSDMRDTECEALRIELRHIRSLVGLRAIARYFEHDKPFLGMYPDESPTTSVIEVYHEGDFLNCKGLQRQAIRNLFRYLTSERSMQRFKASEWLVNDAFNMLEMVPKNGQKLLARTDRDLALQMLAKTEESSASKEDPHEYWNMIGRCYRIFASERDALQKQCDFIVDTNPKRG